MSIVTPKLLYSTEKAGDVPVWEILTDNNQRIYYERKHRSGYRPIGVVEQLSLGGTTLRVCDVVVKRHNESISILKEKDGYIAPLSWYEPELGSQVSSHNEVDSDTESYYSDSDSDTY